MKRIVVDAYIVADPAICHGKPTFKGTRVMVWQVLDMLEDGKSYKQIIDAFPMLRTQHIKAALGYASSLTKEGYVIINTSPQISS